MTDPFEALREPVAPVHPDPDFAGRLRLRLTREVLPAGGIMSQQTETTRVEREPAWPPALSPYLVVSDARSAMDWYVEVFGARRRGELHVNADGTIGHAEVDIGGAVLMFSEASGLWPDVPVRAPDSPATFSHSLRLEVADVDPSGHRWILLTPAARATHLRLGDVAHVTMVARNADRAKEFYEAVLHVRFSAGHPGAWRTDEITPPLASCRRRALSRRCDCPTASATSRRRSSGSGRPAAWRTSPTVSRTGCSPSASTTRARSSTSGSRPTDRADSRR